jgi:hypothetical protein
MAPPRRRRRAVGWILGVPTSICAAVFSAAADNMLAAAMMGALVGFVIGIGILAFPNLDRGGPADNEDFLH